MALIQEDDSSHHRHVLQRPSGNGDSNSNSNKNRKESPIDAHIISAKDPTSSASGTIPSAFRPLHPKLPQVQGQRKAEEGQEPVRPVDRNWARVRQKMIGSDGIAIAHAHLATQSSETGTAGVEAVSSPSVHQQQHSDLKNQLPMNNSIRPVVSQVKDQSRIQPPIDNSGTVSTGIRGVLGFRTVVVQRTQLRKMEKEIEKALARHSNDQSLPRSRTVARIGTSTRGMIPGTSYNLTTLQDSSSLDRTFVDEMSEILIRWKSLTVEVPCKTEILRTLSKMLRVDRPEPMSRIDSAAVLSLFDQMRHLFPLQSESEDLQDVLWCLSLLSPKYACKNDRVIATIQDLLKPNVLMMTVPLSPRNIQAMLASIVKLLNEQAKLPRETQDQRLQSFATELMERIRIGDLGVGREIPNDRPLQEHYAQVAFLKGLIECLRIRDQDTVHFLIHEMIPSYWVEPVSKYPMTMDEPVMILGQVASELVLGTPVSFADGSEESKSLILDLILLIGEFLPPAGLSGFVSKDAVAMLVRFILMVFSIEYLEDQQQERHSTENPVWSEEQETTPRVSTSTDSERDMMSRTPPRTPLSPNVSGENFHSRTLPPHVPNLVVDEQSSPVVQRARAYFDALWENGYQDVIIDQLKLETENISFRRLVNLYHRVVLGSVNTMSSRILTATLNTFFGKLVVHQPAPNERLSRLLLQLSVLHRTSFYKPMMACVASDSTQFVTDYLCVLSCLEMHMGLVDLYMREADLICVIAMTDVGPERPRTDSQTQVLKWGSCTVGQCVIVLEFIYAIKRLARSGDKHQVEVGKMFLIDLERKLGLYLKSKEQKILVPRPMRVLLCLIFYEIRMLCKTIHRPGWLPRILDWAVNYNVPLGTGSTQGGPHGISETMCLRIKHIYSSVDNLVGDGKERYTVKITDTGAGPIRANSTLSEKLLSTNAKAKPLIQPKRLGRMPDIRMDETVAVLKLLITVHSTIHVNEYLQLVEPLWNIYCLESRPKVASAAAFLFVKCADIAPKNIYTLISHDLKSDDPFKRLSAVERLSVLFDHRNELLLQPYVIDPSARGPFGTTAVQVPFVCSEVGSNRYTMDEPRWLTELKSVSNFPVDIRNQFEELGWGERGRQERELARRSQTPLMLSWTGYLDEDYEGKANFGRTYTANSKDRHATVLVPVLNSLNMATIDLLDDRSIGVRSAAIDFLSNYIRNEPVLLVRWLFAEIVQAKPDRQRDLISRLHLLMSASSKLPPGFAFALFNHLLGLLKWYQRSSKPLGIDMMAALLPLLADVVSSTNDIVFKDFKRNKVDVFFGNLGRFWFRPNISPESMFPNRLSDPSNILSQLGVPYQLFQMAVINISQIQFMTSFLVRFPLEVSDIKNSIGRFNRMPRADAAESALGPKLENSQYLPDMSREKSRFVVAMSDQERGLRGLSSLRARAWLCFVLNLIQRMEKNNAQRQELMNIFNGVNVILLEHGNDLGIVGQALDVYVTAATHLRRFFASQNGYMLIFPALFKTYCDSSAIRVVHDTINAAYYRFYLLHQEAFVLQSLGSIVPLMLRHMSREQSTVMARCLFDFLEALDQPTTTYHSKALGVSSLSEPYHESRSYGGPQLEIPEWMSSFISKDSKLFQSSNLLHKREFSMADSIKLFLAVIAFDPGSFRSEQFVRVLKSILPFFLEREPQLMTSGLDSLIEVFSKFGRSSKPLVPPSFVPPPVAPRQSQDTNDSTCELSRFALFPSPLSKAQAVKGKTWAQNDRVAIKHEFVCLIQLFCDRGGQLADRQHLKMAVLIRSIIKDYTSLKIPCTTEWIEDYIRDAILSAQSLQQGCRAVMYLITQFSNVIKMHYKSVDFSGFVDGLLLVAENDRHFLRRSAELSNVLKEKIINPGLALSVKGDWVTDCVHISQAHFCSSLVDLILSMINHADTDTIAELEQATPTPRFMAYIVIPMCLRFKSRFQSNCLDILEMQFWLKMLGLTVKAAEYDPTLRRSSRTAGLFAPMLNVARASRRQASFEVATAMSPQQLVHPPSVLLPPSTGAIPQTPSQSKMPFLHQKDDHAEEDQHQKTEPSMNASPGLLVDFIALRIIMVRGERYLSYHPGCWLDIFSIAKKFFLAHSFVASSFSGPMKYGRQSNSNGSGPTSPNIMTPFPTSPRFDGPRTPDLWQAGGSLSPFPGFFRSSSELTSFAGSGHIRENIPTTALGYMLWTFAETILFNRLPLMIMMRPFLLDQLRMVQDSQALSARPTRSANSSGPTSPAFYWPSPTILPSGQPATRSAPWMSPLRHRSDSGQNERSSGQDPTALKKQQHGERRKQWKSWSKPTQTMTAYTAIDKPLQHLATPMSSHLLSVSHQHQRGLMPMTPEQGGNATSTPRNAINHLRGNRHHRSESENNKSEHVLPKVLVERANKSIDHVRAMMNTATDGSSTFSAFAVPMYPEKKVLSSSSGLSPSMARHVDRRDSSQFPLTESGQGNGNHFLLPGKYEPQPASPGFGSMFLAREAALKAPSLSLPDAALPGSSSSHPSMTLSVPGALPETSRPTLSSVASDRGLSLPRISTGNGNESRSFVVSSPPLPVPTMTIGESSTLAPISLISTALPTEGPKKARSILKPSIVTTSPPKADSNLQFRTSTELPFASVQSPDQHGHQGGRPIQRMDSRITDDGISLMSGGINLDKRPSISTEEKEDYKMASAQARVKIFIQNIEEETRVILACFPSVFSIGFAPLPTASTAAAAAASLVQLPEMTVTAVEPQAAQETEGRTSEGASVVQQNEQARASTPSLLVPSRTMPSIIIQDQSYLAPSPINPLPSALEGGEHLFRSSYRDRADPEEIAMAYRVGSPPPSSAKERRSKSVIFQHTLSTDSSAGGGASASSSHPAVSEAVGASTTQIGTPPILSVTLSSPPPPPHSQTASPSDASSDPSQLSSTSSQGLGTTSTAADKRTLSRPVSRSLNPLRTVVESESADLSLSLPSLQITPSPTSNEPEELNRLHVPLTSDSSSNQ